MERKRVLITGAAIGLDTAEQFAPYNIGCKHLDVRDVADTFFVLATLSVHVNIAEPTILPTYQASATVIPRTSFHH